MKKSLFTSLLVVLFIFSSCANKPSGDPAESALGYLSALAEKDKVTLANLSCKSWEEQAMLESDALLSVGAELNNVSCKISGQEGNFHLVNCTGKLDLTYGEEVRSIDLSLRTYYMANEDGQWRVCSYK